MVEINERLESIKPTAELIPDGAVKESPKQRLLKWIQSKLPPTVQIKV